MNCTCDDGYIEEDYDREILVAEEAETVHFSWNLIWKVFLAMIVASLLLSLLGYILAAAMMPFVSDEARQNIRQNMTISI